MNLGMLLPYEVEKMQIGQESVLENLKQFLEVQF